MIALALLRLIVSIITIYIPVFGLSQLWWIFNTIVACVVVTTFLSLYWRILSPKGDFWGVLIAFIVGIPIFIYGNVLNSAARTVRAYLFIIGISTLFCLVFPSKTEFEGI